MKVLLIDDEAAFVESLAERLQLRGYDVQTVYCAEDGLAMVQRDPPDVALVDLSMPGMGGLELTRRTKALDPSIEVVVLSGHGVAAKEREELERLSVGCVIKPVDFGELLAKINEAGKRRLQSRAMKDRP